MKKAFEAQLEAIKEQNEVKQQECEVQQQNLVNMTSTTQKTFQEIFKSRDTQVQ